VILSTQRLSSIPKGKTSIASIKRTVTGSAVISNSEAQAWCKTDENLTDLIGYVTSYAENIANIAMRTTTVQVVYSSLGREFAVPVGDVVTITSLKDEDGNDVEYKQIGNVITLDEPKEGKHTLIYTALRFTDTMKLVLLKLTLTEFEDRQDNAIGGFTRLPNYSGKLLQPFVYYGY
jgi:hypothetical protein